MKTSFVEYYKSREISPVDQDITDLQLHFSRREALYIQLGITRNNIFEKNILEFGPGSGHNSIYTAFFKPKQYTLVDGNIFGLKKANKLLNSYYLNNSYQFVQSLIENYHNFDKLKYSLVLCEGVLPFQIDPKKILKDASQFVEDGGIIAITTSCSASFFAEYLRRIYFRVATKDVLNIEEKEKSVHNEIDSHLNTLVGRSRSTKDWIQDSFQPLNQRPSFSIKDAFDVLNEEFTILGSSPSLLTDYRWYKSIPFGKSRNELMKEIYYKNIHNYIDCRNLIPEIEIDIGEKIIEITSKIELLSWKYELDFCYEDLNIELILELQNLNVILLALNLEKTVTSINEFINFLKTGTLSFQEFRCFWGKGQQYLSFVKNSNYTLNS